MALSAAMLHSRPDRSVVGCYIDREAVRSLTSPASSSSSLCVGLHRLAYRLSMLVPGQIDMSCYICLSPSRLKHHGLHHRVPYYICVPWIHLCVSVHMPVSTTHIISFPATYIFEVMLQLGQLFCVVIILYLDVAGRFSGVFYEITVGLHLSCMLSFQTRQV
jgi:hypothetical protein